MGLQDFFTIKTPQQRKAEQRQYNAWAFPYGKPQQEIVTLLLAELLPDEKETGMAVYLIGREAYRGAEYDDYSEYTVEERLRYTQRKLKGQLPGRHKHKIWRYLALIQADEQVDENLGYPSAEVLRQRAVELEQQLGW